MDKIILAPVRGLEDKDLLTQFLYSAGLIERKKTHKEPLILTVMKIFVKNKGKHITYEFLIESLPKTKDKNLRSNVVKVCKKLADFGLIERTAYVPENKKRWERAFRFVSFSKAVQLTKQRTEFMLNTLEKIGDQLDEQ
jgi:hypothetical protein